MAADVRIEIEHDEIVRSPVKNEVGLVLFGVVAEISQNTQPPASNPQSAGSDVFGTPGTPQPVQCLNPLASAGPT